MKKRNTKRDLRNGIIVFLTLALVYTIGMTGGRVFEGNLKAPAAYAEAATAQAMPASDPSPALYVAEANANSVVGVITNIQDWNRSSGKMTENMIAQGSGVVIQEGGYILTNYHVIADGTAYQILLTSGEKADAVLVGSDNSLDLAVLKVEDKEIAKTLVPVAVGSAESLRVGSTVVAIGNPGGEVLANTVTQGIVSALERSSVNSKSSMRTINYIQHDAAINSGNSGGGLFNYKGELVGINTLKYGGSIYSSVTFEGLGFAIPVDTAMPIVQQLIEYGKVQRPAMGVSVSNYDGPEEPLPNYAPASVLVSSVNEGSPAEAAGIKQYDFIYAINDERVTTLAELTTILDQHKAGDTIKLTLVRYNEAGYYNNPNRSSIFGFGYGYGYDDANSGYLTVGGGYEMITVDVTLEILD